MGYIIIGIALLLFVQVKNVFPQLLLLRLLFSIGGAATSTMVTAMLPSMIAKPYKHDQAQRPSINDGAETAPSIVSELTITPTRVKSQSGLCAPYSEVSPTRLAGIVGFCTGCGALLALGIFLRLPELFQRIDIPSEQALEDTYYIVGSISLILSVLCYAGLRNLHGEEAKGWRALLYTRTHQETPILSNGLSSLKSLCRSISLGFQNPLIGLAYTGGFVARASSVGISLFIPLFVNAYYISSGRCDQEGQIPQDAKARCQGAYVLAAELTGTSQVCALIFAPIYGYVADKYRRYNVPLLGAAVVGILGYITLATLDGPEAEGPNGSPWIFVVMALLGISQIGAIVCSLGLLSRGILGVDIQSDATTAGDNEATIIDTSCEDNGDDLTRTQNHQNREASREAGENLPLLPPASRPREHLKGSISGVYSLAGGLGILILTKVGGLLFDRVSVVAPFYMLAVFNGLLLVSGFVTIMQQD